MTTHQLSQENVNEVLSYHSELDYDGNEFYCKGCTAGLGTVYPDKALTAHQSAMVWELIEKTTTQQWGVHLFTSQWEPDLIVPEEEARKTYEQREGFFRKLVSRRVTDWEDEG